MRLTEKELHPSVFTAIHELTGAVGYGTNTDPAATKAYYKHSGIWFKEYWKGLTAYASFLPGIILATAWSSEFLNKPGRVGVFFGLLAIWIAAGVFLYQKNQKLVTLEELQALKDTLTLTPNQKLYLDCVTKVLGSTVLDESQKAEWLESLYQTIENSNRLESIRNHEESQASRSESGLLQEVDKLETRIASTNDPIARQAYEQGLGMVQRRLGKQDSMATQLERSEAHLELIRQTLLDTSHTLTSLTTGVATKKLIELDTEGLRANLSRIQQDSDDILRAVEELNAN